MAEEQTKAVIDGDPNGGPFTIRGAGFGEKGSVKVGEVPVRTTKWSATSIKGDLPKGLKGAVSVVSAAGVAVAASWAQPTKKA